MSNVTRISTDRTIIDTNPNTPRVLYRGSVDIATGDFANVGSGYIGQATVDLNFLKKEVLNPEIDLYRYVDSGEPTYSRSLTKCPYTNRSSLDGTENFNVSQTLFWDFETELRLLISVWALSAPVTDLHFFYVIYSTSVVLEDILDVDG